MYILEVGIFWLQFLVFCLVLQYYNFLFLLLTDPLAQLIKSEESPYTDIDENTWFSIEKNNVHVIRENRNVEGNYIDSTESVIPLECVVNKIDENILIEAIIKSAESFLKR